MGVVRETEQSSVLRRSLDIMCNRQFTAPEAGKGEGGSGRPERGMT
jgi:hypothetical protein